MKLIHRVLLIGLCLVLVVATVSAFQWDNRGEYRKDVKEYTIKNVLGFGRSLATYKLTKNTDQCLIKCEAEGIANLFEDNTLLFDGFTFKDIQGRDMPVSYKLYIKNKGKWIEYDNSPLSRGNYQWRLEGRKNAGDRVDWVGSVLGVKLSKWAWWDSSWQKRANINITGGGELFTNFTTLINVTYDADMQSDFDDLRFINGTCLGTQTDTLYYEIDNITDSSYALVWVNMPVLPVAGTEICMYYNNDAATTTEDSVQAWDNNYMAVWHMGDLIDSKGMHNLTNVASTPFRGTIIGSGAFLDGSGQYFTTPDDDDFDLQNFTLEAFGNITDSGGNSTPTFGIMGQGETDADRWSFYTEPSNLRYTLNIASEVRYNPIPTTSSGVPLHRWRYLTAIRDFQQGNVTTLLNNSFIGTGNGTFTGLVNFSGTLKIGNGRASSPTELWRGELDEIRISNLTRSLNWLNRSFDNVNFTTFVFGLEQNIGNVVQVQPIDGGNFSGTNILFECNASTENFPSINVTNLTFSTYNVDNSLSNRSNFNFGGIHQNETVQFFMNSTGDGTRNWWCSAGYTDDSTILTLNNTFNVDTTVPNVTLTQPSLEGNTSAIEIQVSASDDSTPFSCRYEWDSNGTQLNLDPCENTTVSFGLWGIHNITIIANDTIGNTASIVKDFVAVEQVNQTFNANITLPSLETFAITINDTNNTVSNVILNYNGTNYTGILRSSSGSRDTYNTQVNIPADFSGIKTTTFNWTILGVVNGTLSNYIYLSETQTAAAIQLSNTTDGFACDFNEASLYTINYTLKYESNGSLASNFNVTAFYNVWTESKAVSANFSWSEAHTTTTYPVCIFPNYTQAFADVKVSYGEGDFTPREFNLLNQSINSTTLLFDLFFLETVNADSVTVTITDDNDLSQEGFLVEAYLWNIAENEFDLVESKVTDPEGIVVLSLNIGEGQLYQFLIYDENGILVRSVDKFEVTATSYTFRVVPAAQFGLDVINDLDKDFSDKFSLTYSDVTFNVTLTWDDSTTDIIDEGCLKVIQRGVWNDTSVLTDQCSPNDTQTMRYNIGNATNEYAAIFYVIASVDGSDYVLKVLTIDQREGWQLIGLDGAFWAFLIILTFSIMFATVPTAMILVDIILLSIFWQLQIIGIGGTSVLVLIILGIFLMLKIMKQN